ncbi:MAG: S8 family serine peptidase, partial [Acidobacteriota bacterium]|nr:S8 family serine peptidase [Acidobacteriota bacterium]
MWRASLMSLRVLDNTGTGDIANAVEAIDYAVSHGAQVINLSWGTTGESQALKYAIERAMRRGVVVVCSAGNSSQNVDSAPYYPASFGSRDLVTVAGTDNFDQLASWSNWGRRNVSVAAPGTNILTTRMGGGYWSVSGTSAAAPLVAGVAGLIKSLRPQLNTHNVVKAITDQARQVASLSSKVVAGGVINAAAALDTIHGSGNAVTPVRPPTPGYGSGGTGPGGTFSTTPPPRTTSGPGLNLPNLDQIRRTPTTQPRTQAPIQSNSVCADCDPLNGGGGGSYYPSGDPNFGTARERPGNETGQPGVDLGSRNFNWSMPLVTLAGRAGLDLNLSLYYNSLVWTKDGNFIKYNADLGSPAPGFRVGLPTLQQRFYNSQTGIYAYMMVTPSGGRIELRQVGTSNIYESQDGSYTQLDVSNPNAPLVRTSDGTQLSFIPAGINSEYRCTQIKDRNGNYISATYDANNGHLLTVTDTLGRTITFVHDAIGNLVAIRQMWGSTAHDWATFIYGDVYVAPSFGGGLLVNGPNNNLVAVLTRVDLHDGSSFRFDYNAAFGQVKQVNHHAADGHLLSYVSYNLDTSAGQTDCPRFTERRDWGEFGVMNQSAEVLTTYSVAGDGSWSQQTAPDGTISKEFFATTGWQTGLSTSSEIWSAGVKKKWTTISWTQDDENLLYQKNPRVTETNIYDAEGNRRRVAISYYPVSSFSLPSDVYEYAADGATLLRRSHIDYNLNPIYIDRRIIGLVFGQYVYDGGGALQSKQLYHRDWDSGWLVEQSGAAQHDDGNYGVGFVNGRANLVLVERYDVQYPDDQTRVLSVKTGYNTTGSVIFSGDGRWHRTDISYTDAFSDGINRNTFAFPTTVTDPDGKPS